MTYQIRRLFGMSEVATIKEWVAERMHHAQEEADKARAKLEKFTKAYEELSHGRQPDQGIRNAYNAYVSMQPRGTR